jgi:hypothetical protein
MQVFASTAVGGGVGAVLGNSLRGSASAKKPRRRAHA